MNLRKRLSSFFIASILLLTFATPQTAKADFIGDYEIEEPTNNETETPDIPAQIEDVVIDDASVIDEDDSYFYVRLIWSYPYEYADEITGYRIYRSTSPDGDFTFLDYTTSMAFTDDTAKYGVKYYYKIVAYIITESGEICSNGAISSEVIAPLEVPSISSIKSVDGNSLKLTWKVTSYAQKYNVYRSEEKEGTYESVGTKNVKSTYEVGDSITFTDTGLKLGNTYYYRISPVIVEDGIVYEGSFSQVKSAQVKFISTKIVSGKSSKPETNTISWNKVKDASGYILYCSVKNKKKYQKLKEIKGNKKLSYTHKKLTNGVRYNYKICAYKNTSDYGKVMSNYSSNFEKYCDYYTYEAESYTSKAKRMFNKKQRILYKSDAKARKNMTTVAIRVWDKSGSRWFTRKFWLTVHKSLAPSVDKMFKEIYKSKSRFPIHDIGCYSWRGKGSYSEHCIGAAFDINSNENYMIDHGVVLAGSLWKPKSNKYSIPLKCELVNILKKYGFYRGFWGKRKDYMHFSYFGT